MINQMCCRVPELKWLKLDNLEKKINQIIPDKFKKSSNTFRIAIAKLN